MNSTAAAPQKSKHSIAISLQISHFTLRVINTREHIFCSHEHNESILPKEDALYIVSNRRQHRPFQPATISQQSATYKYLNKQRVSQREIHQITFQLQSQQKTAHEKSHTVSHFLNASNFIIITCV